MEDVRNVDSKFDEYDTPYDVSVLRYNLSAHLQRIGGTHEDVNARFRNCNRIEIEVHWSNLFCPKRSSLCIWNVGIWIKIYLNLIKFMQIYISVHACIDTHETGN